MESIVRYFLERKVLVTSIIIAVLVIGAKTLVQIPKEGFPHVALNKAVITTIYPGANARDVEYNVTIPIEEELLEIDGIDELKSVSREGVSIITITVDEDKNEEYFNKIYMEIDGALGRISDLPDNVEGRPKLEQIDSFDKPIVEITLSGNYKKIQKFAPFLEKKLKELDELSGIDTVGLPDDEINILVDPNIAKKHLVDFAMIKKAISLRNIEGTGGTLIIDGQEKKVVTLSKYQDVDQLLNTNIRISVDGEGVKLRDVAKIEILPKDNRLLVRNNGKRGVSLLLKKKGDVDILKTVDSISRVLKEVNVPKDVELKLLNDQSAFTRARLKVVVGNAIIGIILVTMLLFLVLDLKTALWTAFGIPFSLLVAYSLFPIFNLTLNILAMGGFIIVIGMVVDDAIVIAERINTNKENGMSAVDSCVNAVGLMWKPVLAATGTTILAFSPLLSLGGLPGKFIWVIPLIVILVLIASLFEAYFMLPAHLLHISAKKVVKKRFVIKLENIYKHILLKALHFKYITIAIFIVLLGSSLFLAKNVLKKDVFPQESVDSFYITVTAPIGTTKESAENYIKRIEEKVFALPSDELDGFSSRIGTHSTDQKTDRGSQYNMSTVFVYLTPYADRERNVFKIMDELKTSLSGQVKEVDLIFNIFRLGPPLGNGYEVYISSEDDNLRKQKEVDVKKYLSTHIGVIDIQDDNVEGNIEYNIVINYDNLESFGLSVADIVNTLRIAFDGMIITSNTTISGTVDYRLRLNKSARRDVHFLNSLPVLNRSGELLDMSKLVTIEKRESRGEISHLNGKRTTKVFGNVDKLNSSPDQVIEDLKNSFKSSAAVEITYGGEAIEGNEIFGDLKWAVVVAFAGIFLVLALVFNSFTMPFVIMAAIPFIIVGVMWSIFLHGVPLSMFIGVSIVGLMGIVVNDSIVMIHTINVLRKTKPISASLLVEGAVSRLRAILLTTTTTTAGLLPTAYGIGGYDPMISPMCLALTYGLLFGTFVVLFLIPSLYLVLHQLRVRFSK